MNHRIRISAPSRLHFGLLRFQSRFGRSYGGLGAMINRPRLVLEMRASERWSATGRCGPRAKAFAEQALQSVGGAGDRPIALDITVQCAMPEHRGLGGGTQLALSIAAGVAHLTGKQDLTIEDLANLVGRGKRSAVGSHGFAYGGLIWEDGYAANERLGRLAQRVALPSSWRFVLLREDGCGLFGRAEQNAFDSVPSVPLERTRQLRKIVEATILPAAESADVNAFGEGVYQYGRLAGECFCAVQGGAYANPRIAERVGQLRRMGVTGVGQSSWGSTVFALVESQHAAEDLVSQLRSNDCDDRIIVEIAAPDNFGAVIDRYTVESPMDDAPRGSLARIDQSSP